MLARATRYLDRLLGLEGQSPRDAALLEERFRALQRYVPWIYGILLVNLAGLYISFNSWASVFELATLLAALTIIRLLHWLWVRGIALSTEKIKAELRKTFVIAGLFCASYCWWSLNRYYDGPGDDRIHIVLFASMAAIGCSFGLSVFPAAARLPLLLLAMPVALQLISDGNAAHVGMGLSILVLAFLTLRLNGAHNMGFEELVYARFDVERERERATTAEKIANTEKSRVRQLADTDVLTGIANRRAFFERVEEMGRIGHRNLAVALVDLDGFKPINDTFGHETGDKLLIEVSRRLRAIVDGSATVARLGGDEFAILFPCTDAAAARTVCETVVARLAEPFHIDHRTLTISCCVGVCFHGADRTDFGKSLRQADIALYQAKRTGKGRVELFSPDMQATLQRRISIEQALREPAIEDSIEVAFQPIIDLHSMRLQSFEALARWRHSELGWIAPSEFIPITEHLSVVDRISSALLAQAAEQASRWPETVRLSFNLSAVELCSVASADRILAILRDAGLCPSRLQVEVTETALLADFDVARDNLAHLGARGVKVLLDDFGAGYASVSYLREIGFDAVKLDGSIVTRAASGEGLPLLTGVLRLCEAMDLPCVAEHVETASEAGVLRELGCRYGQGFGLARPMSAHAAAEYAQLRAPPRDAGPPQASAA